jgi:DNA primase
MAGRIPQSFIDDLISRVDIVEIIDERVPLKKAGHEYKACCPFHGEKTPSFTVSPTKQFYHCFGCGAHGTALGFLMEYDHMGFVEAIEDLAHRYGMTVPYEQGSAPGQKSESLQPLYDIMEESDHYYRQQLRQHPQAPRAVDYLKGRGLSGQIAAEFGIGYAPPGWDNLLNNLGQGQDARCKLLSRGGMLIEKEGGGHYDRFRDRVMFPIRDARGRTIAFGGRVLPGDDNGAKYLNSPETPLFHKGRELYGLYEARKAVRKLERLIVVEGYMDVVSLAQHGVRNCVATLGTATTADHLHKLFRIVPEVVFCFDGDRAGRDAAWRALNNALPVLREGFQIRFMFLPEGEDPDTLIRQYGADDFNQRVANAQTFSEYFFEFMGTQADIHTIDGRARLVELIRPLLAKLPEGVFAQMMWSRLAELVRMEVTQLRGGKTSTRPPPGPSNRPVSKKSTPSPMRTAIAALLRAPQLANEVADCQRFATLESAGGPLLTAMLEFIQSRPQIHTATLLEHWRGHEYWEYLDKLARHDPLINEEQLSHEFHGALKLLDAQLQNQRWEQLQHKVSLGQITDEEKLELKQLIEQMHKDTV